MEICTTPNFWIKKWKDTIHSGKMVLRTIQLVEVVYSPSTNMIYQRFGGMWRIWTRLHTRGQIGVNPKFRYLSNCINLPTQIFQATVKHIHNNIIQLTGWSEHYFHDNEIFNLQSAEEWID